MKCIENAAKKSATNGRSAVFSHLWRIQDLRTGYRDGYSNKWSITSKDGITIIYPFVS